MPKQAPAVLEIKMAALYVSRDFWTKLELFCITNRQNNQ